MSAANDFRPTTLDELIGNEVMKKTLQGYIKEGKIPRVILLTSDTPGVGKTTTARIMASILGCQSPIEYNCGTDSNIDKVRDLVSSSRESSLFDERKVIILDEIQKVSKQAQDALLKDLEDGGDHVYWILCTTEIDKIIKPLQTRCKRFHLAPMAKDESKTIMSRFFKRYNMRLQDKSAGELLYHFFERSEGSYRQLLQDLESFYYFLDKDALGHSVITADALSKFLGESSNPEEALNLPRLFSKLAALPEQDTLRKVIKALEAEKDKGKSAYGVLLGVYNYLRKVWLNSSNEHEAEVFTLGAISAKLEDKEVDWIGAENLALRIYAMKGKGK